MKVTEMEKRDWAEEPPRLPARQPFINRLQKGDGLIWTLLVTGGALLGYGIIRRNKLGLVSSLAGSALLFQGSQMAKDSDSKLLSGLNPELNYQRTVTVSRPADELYEFVNHAENLASFMPHVKSVKQLTPTTRRWVMNGPMGKEISWNSEIISNIPGRLIAWQSMPGAPMEQWGSVSFTPAREGETEVCMTMSYHMPAGRLGSGIAALFGRSPDRMTRAGLRRFKQLMEAGEIATTVGQPHGRRGLRGRLMQTILGERALMRDQRLIREKQAAQEIA